MKVCETFKACERDCQTSRPGRAESDAEHTWHLALFLMLLEKDLPGVDFQRLIKIALIHDMPEIYAGDTNPYRDDTSRKDEKERQAADKLFELLPPDLETEFKGLFQEYQDQRTLEARMVKSADKLLPLVQNIRTHGSHSSYRRLKVRFEEVKRYMDPFFTPDDVLGELYARLLAEARDLGVFYRQGEKGK
jgi:putative hydrolase of HD superfamily